MLKILSIFVLIQILISGCKAALDCSQQPKDMVKIQNQCCSSPHLINEFNDESQCREVCSGVKIHSNKSMISSKKVKQDFSKINCFSDCMMYSIGVLTNGNIDTKKIMQVASRFLTTTWQNVFQAGVTHCAQYAESKKNQNVNGLHKSQSVYFLACFDQYLYMHCPVLTAKKECKNLKTYYEQCGIEKRDQ